MSNAGNVMLGHEQNHADQQNSLRTVAKNSVWLVVGQLIGKLLNFAYILLLARHLGVEDFGHFNLVISFVMVADIATDCGLTRLIIRDLACDASQIPRYLGALIPLKLALIVLGYGAMLIAVPSLGYRPEIFALTVFAGLGMLPLGLGTLLDAVCHASQKMQWSALAQIMLALTQTLVGSLVLLAGGKVYAALAVSILANTMFCLTECLGARALNYRIAWSLNVVYTWQLFKAALPFAGIAILGALALRIELLLLGWFHSSEQLGLFSTALRFYEAGMVVPVMLASACTPAMSKFHGLPSSYLSVLYRWTLGKIALLCTLASLIVWLVGERLVTTLFPATYLPAIPLLQYLFLAFPFAGIYVLNGSLLLASPHAKRAFAVALGVVLMQCVVAVWCIPLYAAQGAVWAVCITQMSAAILTTILLARWYRLFHRANNVD